MARLTISVLMSTYNRAHLLPEALDSLLAQTRVPDEIIVVDDGSTDETPAVLAKYGPPLKVIRQENRGLPAGRNTGLRAATGDLIAFLDSDDVLPLTSIALRADVLEAHSEVMAVYGAAYMTDMQNKMLGWFRPPPLPRGNIFAESACRVVFPMHAVMFRRECVGKVGYFDEDLPVQLDLDYWIRFSAIYPFEVINEPLAYYRIHDQMSVLVQPESVSRKGIIAQQRVFSMPAFASLSPRQQAKIYSVHGTRYFQLGDNAAARQWYRRAIRTAPTYLRPYLLLAVTTFGKGGFDTMARLYHRLRGEAASLG